MQTVIGLFENAQDANRAAQELKNNGFSSDNVDVTIRGDRYDSSGTDSSRSMGYDNDTISDRSTAGSDSISRDYSTDTDSSYRSTSEDSSYTGDDTYRNRDRDDDNNSFGDKVSRFFKNLFGGDDDRDSDRYVHVANSTGCMVTVHAQSKDEAERAADILDENGAIDVDEKASAYGYTGSTGNTYDSDRSSDRLSSDDIENDKLNVIREDVEIGKRQVESGGVRLRSRIIERPVEEQVRLREERIRVERNPVDRAATTSDIQNFKEGEIEMTEYAEVPQIKKQARVVEEVKISKDVDERTETVNTTAMDTEVEVENVKKKKDKRGDDNL